MSRANQLTTAAADNVMPTMRLVLFGEEGMEEVMMGAVERVS